ncbi:MAG: site-specific integrase [Candidatus Hydrogenedentes bacterium]|nr:site-specific integrase [Candidatus Hydrogenedentota bacterium]
MLTLSRRGGVWHLRLRLSSGLDARRSTGESDKVTAELAALRIIADMGIDGAARHAREGMALSTFERLHAEWATARHTATNRERTRYAFLALSRFMGADVIPTAARAEAFVQTRAANTSPATANVDLRTLRAAFNVGVAQGWIKENPFGSVRLMSAPKHERPALSPVELRQVLDAARIVGGGIDIACHLAGLAGLRAGECAACCADWADLSAGVLTVKADARFMPKGKRSRTVPIHPELRDCLMRHARDIGRYISTDSVPRKGWTRVQNMAGVRVPFHSLRHTAATLWAASGVPAFTIQGWLGHSSVTTTEGYVHAACQAYDARVNFTLPDAPAKQERAGS